MNRVLIIGATSAIAEAYARLEAARGSQLFLLARSQPRMDAIGADLLVRGARSVGEAVLDVNELDAQEPALAQAWQRFDGFDRVLIAHGTLPDQAACEIDVDLALREFATNGTATIALMTRIGQRLKAQGRGSLAVISSVAGDRGRASNYLYGSAKAAVSTFASGLGQHLHRSGVQVLLVKPGFVDTPMTASFRKSALWAKPAAIALGIDHAIGKRRAVLYLPWFWWPIMQIIKNIPEAIFRRIRL